MKLSHILPFLIKFKNLVKAQRILQINQCSITYKTCDHIKLPFYCFCFVFKFPTSPDIPCSK